MQLLVKGAQSQGLVFTHLAEDVLDKGISRKAYSRYIVGVWGQPVRDRVGETPPPRGGVTVFY